MKLVKKKNIYIGITVLYMGFIFFNSMMPAVESSRQSSGVLTIILEIAGRLGVGGYWITEHLIRKSAHFAEYAVLGILLGIDVRQYFYKIGFRRLMQCWLGILIPFIDETIQLFVEGRSGQISDVWLDMAGVLTGYLVIGIISYLRRAGEERLR